MTMDMKKDMGLLRAGTWGVAVLAIVPHIFTCVLPTVAMVLGTTGLLGTAWMHTAFGQMFMKYHFLLLIVATLATVVGFVSTLVRYRCGCGPACACGPNCDCETAPRGGKKALVFSALLLVLVGASWLASPWKHAEHMAMMQEQGMPMDMMMDHHAGMHMPEQSIPPAQAPEAALTQEDAMQTAEPMDHGEGMHVMPEGEMR